MKKGVFVFVLFFCISFISAVPLEVCDSSNNLGELFCLEDIQFLCTLSGWRDIGKNDIACKVNNLERGDGWWNDEVYLASLNDSLPESSEFLNNKYGSISEYKNGSSIFIFSYIIFGIVLGVLIVLGITLLINLIKSSEKKGISDVILAVLMVLIAIMAFMILAFFVIKFTSEGVEDIKNATEDFDPSRGVREGTGFPTAPEWEFYNGNVPDNLNCEDKVPCKINGIDSCCDVVGKDEDDCEDGRHSCFFGDREFCCLNQTQTRCNQVGGGATHCPEDEDNKYFCCRGSNCPHIEYVSCKVAVGGTNVSACCYVGPQNCAGDGDCPSGYKCSSDVCVEDGENGGDLDDSINKINSCGIIIDEPGIWRLENSLMFDTQGSEDISFCILINSSDVVLEGNNKIISGDLNSIGLFAEDKKNVTIKNLEIKNFLAGVVLINVSDSNFEKSYLHHNLYFSALLFLSKNNQFGDLTINNNTIGIMSIFPEIVDSDYHEDDYEDSSDEDNENYGELYDEIDYDLINSNNKFYNLEFYDNFVSLIGAEISSEFNFIKSGNGLYENSVNFADIGFEDFGFDEVAPSIFLGLINSKLANLDLFNNSAGFVFFGFGNELSNINSYDNSVGGLFFAFANNTVSDLSVYNNNQSVSFFLTSGNNFSNVNVFNNVEGVRVVASRENKFENLTSFNNSESGLIISYSQNNSFIDSNLFYNNLETREDHAGIKIVSVRKLFNFVSRDNSFSNVYSCGNGAYDLLIVKEESQDVENFGNRNFFGNVEKSEGVVWPTLEEHYTSC